MDGVYILSSVTMGSLMRTSTGGLMVCSTLKKRQSIT